MPAYILRRLGQSVFALWATYTVTFVILFWLPSDPVSIMLNLSAEDVFVDPARIEALRQAYGFDEPVWLQYLHRLGAALLGDFGTSVQTGQPVLGMILAVLPETLLLTSVALLLAMAMGLAIAMFATMSRHRWLADFVKSLPALGFSVPSFWVGLMLLQLLSFQLGWLPPVGNRGWQSLVMPALTLAIPTSAMIAQVLIRSLEHILDEPFIATAVATGASPLRVQLVHALRNAVLPTVTILGLAVGGLLAGSVVTETVFSRAGMGRLTHTSVTLQDIPVVQGLAIVSAFIFVTVNLAVDLVYPLLDPRIRRAEQP